MFLKSQFVRFAGIFTIFCFLEPKSRLPILAPGFPTCKHGLNREYPGFELVFRMFVVTCECARTILWPNSCLEVWNCVGWDTDAAVVASFNKRTWNCQRLFVEFYYGTYAFARTFCSGHASVRKLRYFVFNFHIKAPPSPQCSAASNYILETGIILALALRFVWRTGPRPRWLAFRQKFTFWFSCALGCRASSSCHRIPELYSDE